MALQITVKSVEKLQRHFRVRITVAASGSYTAGGDTLNFLTATYPLGYSPVPSTGAPVEIFPQSQQPAASGTATRYEYRALLGTTAANCALQVFTSGASGSPQSELAAGAYPAGVTGDVIEGFALFPGA